MSQALATLRAADNRKNLTRAQIIALQVVPEFKDGRTKQCFKDECDINKIMARFDQTGTISHVTKYEGVYADFADYEFNAHMQKLIEGREVFDALPAEIRREFNHSPADFFKYVNDPANKDDLLVKLPELAAPGNQLPSNLPEPTEPVEPAPEPTPDPA